MATSDDFEWLKRKRDREADELFRQWLDAALGRYKEAPKSEKEEGEMSGEGKAICLEYMTEREFIVADLAWILKRVIEKEREKVAQKESAPKEKTPISAADMRKVMIDGKKERTDKFFNEIIANILKDAKAGKSVRTGGSLPTESADELVLRLTKEGYSVKLTGKEGIFGPGVEISWE